MIFNKKRVYYKITNAKYKFRFLGLPLDLKLLLQEEIDMDFSTFNKSYASGHTKISPASVINGLSLEKEMDASSPVTPTNESVEVVELVHDENEHAEYNYDNDDIVRIGNEEIHPDDYEDVEYIKDSTSEDDVSSSIEGIPYSREFQGNPRTKNKKAMSEITFGTEYVAKELGVSAQAIRNYVEDYNEFLGIEYSPTGRRIFHLEQIEKLRNIMQIKEERGYTTARMQAYLRDPDNEKKVASPEERMEEMFGKMQLAMQQSMMESMRSFAGELIENNAKLLEMKESINNQIVDELKEQVIDQGKAISELLDIVKNQAMDDKKYEDSLRVIEELKASIQQKDKNLEELTETIKKQKDEYEYLQKTTRKKIFGVF